MGDGFTMFEGLLTGNLSDAAEAMGLRRSIIFSPNVLGLRGGSRVGRAFTMRQNIKRQHVARTESLVRQGEVSSKLAQPGDFVVIDTGGITEVATWGENHSRRCQARGIVGMLTNGATRDADQIDGLGFPVFCGGFSPVKSLWDFETTSIGEPVNIGSVQIRSGDYIIADRTGIIVLSPETVTEVVASARKIRDRELAAQATQEPVR